MRSYLTKNIISLTLAFLAISTILLFSYIFISEKIIDDTIQINVSSVGESVASIVSQQITHDYQQVENIIKTVNPQGLTQTQYLDQILLLKNQISLKINSVDTDGGIGLFVNSDPSQYQPAGYIIDQIHYYGNNLIYQDDSDQLLVSICNFYQEYYVDNGNQNQFLDQRYLVFRYDQIIIYFNADLYLEPLLTYPKSIEMSKYFIVSSDGKVSYQSSGKVVKQLFNYLRNYNGEQLVEQLITDFENINSDYFFLSSFNTELDESYLMVTPLIKTTNQLDPQSNLYLVLIFPEKEVANIVKGVSIPLLTSFVVLDIGIIVIGLFSYYLITRKNNDLESILSISNNTRIYQIHLNNKGKFKVNHQLKKKIKDLSRYQTFNDFKFKEEFTDYIQAAFQQRELTMYLSKDETTEDQEKFIRFISLRYFNKRYLFGVNVTDDEIKQRNYYRFAILNSETNLANIHVAEDDISLILANCRGPIKPKTVSSFVSCLIDHYQRYDLFFGPTMGNKVIIEVIKEFNLILANYHAKTYHLKPETLGILFTEMNDYQEVVDALKAILKRFEKPLEIEGNVLMVELYFGVFNINLKEFPDLDHHQVINYSLRSLTKVKNFANLRYDIFDISLLRFITNEEAIRHDLQLAIEKKEFIVVMQPQYDLFNKRICGFELLMRWNHPKYINQSPMQFIELAEKNSMIIPIGKVILQQAFKTAKLFEQYDLIFSINISPVQILQVGFVNELLALTNEYQVSPHNIAIEITETFLMENFRVVNEKISLLRQRGFVIHLDDFGTGYSSFLYLKELAIDAIKIDKEFTKQIGIDQTSKEIVAKIISMAKNLKLEVIAEGVEDEKQLSFLQRSNCNIIQGYLISRPIGQDEAMKLIEDQKSLLNFEERNNKTKKK